MENRTKIQFLAFLTGMVEDLKALNAPDDMIEHYENLIKNIKRELDQERKEAKVALAIMLTYLDMFLEERRKEKEQEQKPNTQALNYITQSLEVRQSPQQNKKPRPK